MKIFYPSSALFKEKFDCIRTIEEASKFPVQGVQLYINGSFTGHAYCDKLLGLLNSSKLDVLWHLPNSPTEKDLDMYLYLIKSRPAKGLVHYLPLKELPLKGADIGWENSLYGEFYKDHVLESFAKARENNTFFVFDITRVMYLDEAHKDPQEILDFVVEQMKLLTEEDVIHFTEKKSWYQTGRQNPCTFGEGVLKPIAQLIKDFGGIVVPEFEELDVTSRSIFALLE